MDSPGEPDGKVLDNFLEVVLEVGQHCLASWYSICICFVAFWFIHHWLRRGIGIHGHHGRLHVMLRSWGLGQRFEYHLHGMKPDRLDELGWLLLHDGLHRHSVEALGYSADL